MLDLTPGERRGALTLLVLLLLGTAHDLWLARQSPAGLPPVLSHPAVAGASAPGAESGGAASAPPAATTPPVHGPVDLNRATLQELDALPGIGPVLASRIVAERARIGRFRSREDLFAVPGIGPKLFARLAPLVSVGGEPSSRVPTPGQPAGNRADRTIR